MNNTKNLGRPRNFDVNEALWAAVNVFWAKGYDGASMKDLTEAMGIKGPSLYAAFGDKYQLYLKAIDQYPAGDAVLPVKAFLEEEDIHAAVYLFIKMAIEFATSNDSGSKGCFYSSCVATTAGESDVIREKLAHTIVKSCAKLASRFEVEIKKGNLPSDFPSNERAGLMFDLRQGYAFRARAGFSKEELLKDIDHRVNMVLAT